jgi:sugar phosphate permease
VKARHTVLSILFATWIVSAVDRMAMSVALPYISTEFRLGPFEGGVLLSAFFLGYSLSHIPGGILADMFGVRRVATMALLWWSAFTAVTGLASSKAVMLIARFVFGLGEGLYPACAFKTIATWFPKHERATANAMMLASNPLGLAISPLVVVAVMSLWGWRAVFLVLFVPGVVIALLFWTLVRDRPSESLRVSPEELAEIEIDGEAGGEGHSEAGGVLQALREPNILRFFLVLFTFDIAFWGFTAWLPTYLVKARGLSMGQMGVVASLPFLVGTIGSVLGGWLSDRFFPSRRRLPIIVCNLVSAVFLYLMFNATTLTHVIVYQTIAGFFLMTFFSVFWALPMNAIPQRVMGIASGFINMAGQIAAFIAPLLFGYLVQITGDFGVTFGVLIAALLVSSALVFTQPNGSVARPLAGSAALPAPRRHVDPSDRSGPAIGSSEH